MSPNSMGFAADFTVFLAPGAHNVFTNKGSTVYYHEIKMFAQVFFFKYCHFYPISIFSKMKVEFFHLLSGDLIICLNKFNILHIILGSARCIKK